MPNEDDRYQHDVGCSKDNFTELNDRGLKTCLDCAGVFDSEGNGVFPNDYRFDENWEERPKG